MPKTTADNCRPRSWTGRDASTFSVPTAAMPAYVTRLRQRRLRMVLSLTGRSPEVHDDCQAWRIVVAYPDRSNWLAAVRMDDACPGDIIESRSKPARSFAMAREPRAFSMTVVPGTVVVTAYRPSGLLRRGYVATVHVPPCSLAPFVAAMRPAILPHADEFDVWHERMARCMAVTNDCPRDILADMLDDNDLPLVAARLRKLFCKPL